MEVIRHSIAEHGSSCWEPTHQQMQLAVIDEPAETTWEQLISNEGEDVWDVTRITSSAVHDITQGFRERRHQAHGSGGVGSPNPSAGYHQMPPHLSM
ncbi:hypothetical protein PIB30_057443 [Stylosanthes scabra]|uniref:Uncharacterized protein n=1 Tax=Stylosanthes scabra TaxID=79078 RepID=A0ABU6VLF4_9FABA|nr:hypothetical protein [Stylosanthes scabra]